MILLNHQHLYYFWVAAQEGSISKASDKLCLAQPTVSGQIIELEKFLGQTLFEREKNRLRLTPEGQLVLKYASDIFGTTQDLLETIRRQPDAAPVRVRIGIDAHVSGALAIRCLDAVTSYRGDAHVIFRQGASADLVKALLSHEVDVVLSERPSRPESRGRLISKLAGRASIGFYATPELAERCRQFPADLAKIPLLLPTSESPLRDALDQYFAEHDLRPLIKGELADTDLMKALALKGFGAAPLPAVAVEAEAEKGSLRPLCERPADIIRRYWLIARDGRRKSPVVEYLFEHFRIA